jgi:trehalose 6-phosphate synthase/phosphatase
MRTGVARVHFSYISSCENEVRIIGSIENIGNWDPNQGIPLSKCGSVFTVSLSFPINTVLEYKYVKMTSPVTWEPFTNRKLNCKHSGISVKDSESSAISEIFYQTEATAKPHHEALPTIKENIKFLVKDSIIFANFNLPIKVTRNVKLADDNFSEKWLIEKNKGIWFPFLYDMAREKDIDISWIGWPGIILEDEEEKKDLSDLLVHKYKCHPVFLKEKELTEFNNFCNNILFQVFNNIIRLSVNEVPQYSVEQWEVYKTVNSIFAEAIMNNYVNQLIWINDYSLMLTPNFVSRRIHELLNIGFYLQSPFPSADLFRILPQAESLLHSILACDLIAMHSFEYASSFLKTCKLLLGLEHHFSKDGCCLIEYFGRHVMVRVGELGVEPEKIYELLETNELLAISTAIKSEFQGFRLLLGIDILHELSGLTLKLKAFRHYIKTHKEPVVLVQYLTKPKLTSGQHPEKLLASLTVLKNKINSIANREAVILRYEDLNPIQRYALMTQAYAIINTSFRDSTSLIPYEFLVVGGKTCKPIIVSENVGVSSSLRSLIKVNPYSKANIYNALANLDCTDCHPFRTHDLDWVKRKTMQKWAISFLNDLKKAQKDPKRMQYMKHGMGDKMKLVALKKNFSKLDLESLLITYKRANYRAMFFDNGGTLTEPIRSDSCSNLLFKPNVKLLECLTDLAKDPQNVIFIVTGREKAMLDNIYHIQHIGLAAEWGAFIKWSAEDDWESRCEIASLWMDTAKYIIESYVQRTEGAIIEEKERSIVFNYNQCDSDYGVWQAKELVSQLDDLLQPYVEDCEVAEGVGYVEVKPRNINKGFTVEYLLEQCNDAGIAFDFVLAIGDDSSDEEMFKVLKFMTASKHRCLNQNARAFSCTLGRKPSEADYYLNDSSEVLQYLEALRCWTKRDSEVIANWNSAIYAIDVAKERKKGRE